MQNRKKKKPWWNQRVVVCSIEEKVQQNSTQIEIPRSAAIEKVNQIDIRRTFKILREVQLNIGAEKVNIHEGITVKAFLNSSMIGMFMNKKMAAKHRFKLQKLERLITVRNVDVTNNSREAIMYQVEVNMYYKNYIERIRMNICNLGRMDIILGILWLQVHNLEINQKTEEVRMTRCLLICRRSLAVKEDIEKRKKSQSRRKDR